MSRIPAIFLLLCLGLPAIAWADKPLPPTQFSQFFSGVIALEDAFGGQDWEGARRALSEIEETFASLRPSLKEQAGEAFLQELSAVFASMELAVGKQQREETKKLLIRAQILIFKAMDSYFYLVHPVILVIDQYVDEALDAGARGDVVRVDHELEEVDHFVVKGAELLEAKGAGRGMQSDFRQALGRARDAGTRRDIPVMLKELKKVKRLSAAFVWMASQK